MSVKPPPTQSSGPVALAVCGDPVVGRALVLLLRGSGYDAKFLPPSSLTEPGSLEGVRLLLLAPLSQLSTTEYYEAFSASLGDASVMGETLVLELVSLSKETREGAARDGSWYTMPWPSRTEDVERKIEAILHTNPRADPAASPCPPTGGEKKEYGA